MTETASSTAAPTTTHHRFRPLCEACFGLEIKAQNNKVTSIRLRAKRKTTQPHKAPAVWSTQSLTQ